VASDRLAVAVRREQLLNRRVVLLAGPSGSGKSRVARLAGCPSLNLDDFYYDGDHPDLPHTLGIVDWDDPRSWNGAAALTAIQELITTGSATVPRYDISRNAAVGSQRVDLDEAGCLIAEGVFAIEMAGYCNDAGVPVESLYLDRPSIMVAVLRFIRDVRERRKPVLVLIRRGFALWRSDPELRRRALAAGFRPVGMREASTAVESRYSRSD
jgi:uridine kinase